jgi:hypothetical protein
LSFIKQNLTQYIHWQYELKKITADLGRVDE